MTNFAETRSLFYLPKGMIYLDGNSLGPLPRAATARVGNVMQDQWGEMLITGWNKAAWFSQPQTIGDRIGQLVGAEPGSIIVGDTLSIKVYQALGAALAMNPDRKVILSDNGNFPTDLYMAEGLIESLDRGLELRTPAPEAIEAAIDSSVAVLMLTEVDYRTGRRHDMQALTAKAHAHGVITVWDLAHSAGAVPVDLAGCGADFACGCTYKYLNGGPGAPAFVYVAPRHADTARPVLSGWLGHSAPFDFDLNYSAHAGVSRMRVGTPPVLQMASLQAALDIWDTVDIKDVHAQSMLLSERLIAAVAKACPQLQLASPSEPKQRGSQVSFHFEHGYQAMQALISRGVIGDFRAPDIMRFGLTPLYISEADVEAAAAHIATVINERLWDKPEFARRGAVT